MFSASYDQSTKETAPEKVLRLALQLPETQNELEMEATRIENLLENLSQPITQTGEEVQCQLVDAMEYLVEGIFALIDAETKEHYDAGCLAVLQCHALVQELQEQVAEFEEEPLLVA